MYPVPEPLSGIPRKHLPLGDTGDRRGPDTWKTQRAGPDGSIWAGRAGGDLSVRAWEGQGGGAFLGDRAGGSQWPAVLGGAVVQSHLEGRTGPSRDAVRIVSLGQRVAPSRRECLVRSKGASGGMFSDGGSDGVSSNNPWRHWPGVRAPGA